MEQNPDHGNIFEVVNETVKILFLRSENSFVKLLREQFCSSFVKLLLQWNNTFNYSSFEPYRATGQTIQPKSLQAMLNKRSTTVIIEFLNYLFDSY